MSDPAPLSPAVAGFLQIFRCHVPPRAAAQHHSLSIARAGRLKAPLSYKNGEAIVKQGDVPIEPRSPNRRSPSPKQLKELAAPLDGMFLLIEGGAQAVKTYWFDRKGVVVYDYRVGKDPGGDFFGEGVLIGATERGATVRAVGFTEVVRIDRRSYAQLRAGQIDRRINEHYLDQLTAEHGILAKDRHTEECQELQEAIEDFVDGNNLKMPKLASTDHLTVKVAATVTKAAVKLKKKAANERRRRASVELAEEKERRPRGTSRDEKFQDEQLQGMRRTVSVEERERQERVNDAIKRSKSKGRRASVTEIDLTTSPNFERNMKTTKENGVGGRYKGRRRSVSDWELSQKNGEDAIEDSSGKDFELSSAPKKGRARTLSDKARGSKSFSHKERGGRERRSSKKSGGSYVVDEGRQRSVSDKASALRRTKSAMSLSPTRAH